VFILHGFSVTAALAHKGTYASLSAKPSPILKPKAFIRRILAINNRQESIHAKIDYPEGFAAWGKSA